VVRHIAVIRTSRLYFHFFAAVRYTHANTRKSYIAYDNNYVIYYTICTPLLRICNIYFPSRSLAWAFLFPARRSPLAHQWNGSRVHRVALVNRRARRTGIILRRRYDCKIIFLRITFIVNIKIVIVHSPRDQRTVSLFNNRKRTV